MQDVDRPAQEGEPRGNQCNPGSRPLDSVSFADAKGSPAIYRSKDAERDYSEEEYDRVQQKREHEPEHGADNLPYLIFGDRPGPLRIRVFNPGGRPGPLCRRRRLRPFLAFFFGPPTAPSSPLDSLLHLFPNGVVDHRDQTLPLRHTSPSFAPTTNCSPETDLANTSVGLRRASDPASDRAEQRRMSPTVIVGGRWALPAGHLAAARPRR